jgi:transposase-like protein
MNTAHLESIGEQLHEANLRRANVIEAARAAAKLAVAEGMSQSEVARALGVDRARTLRRWLDL